MTQVYMPQKKQDDGLGKALTIGGAVVGGIYGGPGGAVTGAGVGQTAGGLLSSSKSQGPAAVPETAMTRKYATVNSDPLVKLQDANTALADLPPDIQQQYGPTIQQATAMERQRRGLA